MGQTGQKTYNLVSAVPQEVICIADIDTFRKQTLVHLLANRTLGLVSIWSPTFLTTLLDFFQTHRDEVLRTLAQSGLNGAAARAKEIRSLCEHATGNDVYGAIWPSLQVISCWTHGPSAPYAESLRTRFPAVPIQPKGLIATEAFVSLPLTDTTDPILAVTSHFFEFRDVDDGSIRLAHELQKDHVYSVIVTTRRRVISLPAFRLGTGDRFPATGALFAFPFRRSNKFLTCAERNSTRTMYKNAYRPFSPTFG